MNKVVFNRQTHTVSLVLAGDLVPIGSEVIGTTNFDNINLVQVRRFYRDDNNVLHEIALVDQIPSREVLLNPGFPPPEIRGMRQYPEQWQIGRNDTAAGDLLSSVKNSAIAQVIRDCDASIEQLKIGYSQNEVLSWPIKKSLAERWLALSSAQKTSEVDLAGWALIVNEAGGATPADRIANTTTLAARILELATIFEAYTGACVAVKKSTMASITAVTGDPIEKISEVQAIANSVQWPPVVIPGAPGT